jgi:3-oxoacyl-[acyl-carrier-protein] synthase II
MAAARADIAIVGAGAACAVGTGCGALWAAVAEGRDGLRPVVRFSVAEFSARVAGLWPGWDGRTQPAQRPGDPPAPLALSTLELALIAAREAWAGAQLDGNVARERVAVLLGTCFGESFVGFSELTEGVAAGLGARGPCLTLSTACSSSTAAIGLGRDLLERGFADIVIAGGADVLTREVFAGFHALGALSRDKCTPLGETSGTTLGEGAGFVVLERGERAAARRAVSWGSVLGYGLSGDAFHDTAPDPSGGGIARAIRGALADAAAVPDDVDYVSAHGTGTESNDLAESLALRAALGPRADAIPVSALKGFLGHAQGAAGVLEAILSLLCARRGVVAPTLRCANPRPGVVADPVAGDGPRPHRTRRLLKVSAAFGGANAALVLGEPVRPRPMRPARTVEVAGTSALGPFGLGVDLLERAVASGTPQSGAVPSFDLSHVLRSAPPRDLDPSGRYLSAAAGLALADAGLAVRGALRERTGLFTGNARMPARSAFDCRASIEQRGITGIAAVPFAHMTLNAPAGTCAKLLSLRGPLLALSTGRASGLAALVVACEHLSRREDADHLLAGGLDELPVHEPGTASEGACLAVVSAAAVPSGTRVSVAGWGLGGPAATEEVLARALEGVPEVDGVYAALPQARERLLGTRGDPAHLPLGLVDVDACLGPAEATASAYAFVLAVAALRRGRARRLLIVSAGDSLCCAAVLAAPGA